MGAKRLPLGLWFLVVTIGVVIVAQTQLRTDMTAFLPRSASVAQQVLTEQVSSGAASHLILLGIEGSPPQILARLSKSLATNLRPDPAFVDVSNGDEASFAGVRDFFWRNRYLLSPDVTADHFTVPNLNAALKGDLGLLGTDMGTLIKQTLPGDPTGELRALLGAFAGTKGPRIHDGVWVSADESRALLLVYTRAAGFDIDAQEQALNRIGRAFDQVRRIVPDSEAARLVESGPAVFAVRTRDTTKHDAGRLSLLATAVAASLLLLAYRSPRVLLLGLLPVATGALVAVAAVSLSFGFVHGITLGFGVTLIGESVDYAIYLFTQTARGDAPSATLARIWPTLRLGALTSIVGFGAMLFSSFVGFAQLGVFSIMGLITAAAVTRFVLPHLMPRNFFAVGAGALGRPFLGIIAFRRWLRPLVALLTLAACLALATHRGHFWDEDLANLSPIPAADQALDRTLRHELGVPDLRYFVVFRTTSEQAALGQSEVLGAGLNRLVDLQRLRSFDVPSRILPSDQTQRGRQAALPDADALRARFGQASAGLPFRQDVFDPFFRDVAAAKASPLLSYANLPPALALQLDSMLVRRGDAWDVIAPLRDVADPASVAMAIAGMKLPGIAFVDLNRESDELLHTFQREATLLAASGSIAILLLLLAGLRSPARVFAVTAPLVAAVIVTAALLTIGGSKLSIFMVVGFLLIVAVGSNYCLFFERPGSDTDTQRRSVASIVLANLCTVSAYGLMSLSQIPVLHDIGITVAMGTFLSLFFAAVVTTRSVNLPSAARTAGDGISVQEGRDRLPSP